MRHLVACPDCRRQVDATGQAPGTLYRCVCQREVRVPSPAGHEAAVVRCSSCGASRAEGEQACRWCASEFTLHEQDLQTICPQCMTRIGNRARFCHACGVAVDPQPIGVSDPARCCPVCSGRPALGHRSLPGGPSLLECDRCAGLWIGPGELRTLLDAAAASGQLLALLGPLGTARPTAPRGDASAGPLYRPCVRCGQRMNRTRFAGRTAVVVDYCKDHGVWFDAEELAQALTQVRQGKVERGVRSPARMPGEVGALDPDERRRREEAWRREGPLAPDRFGLPGPGSDGAAGLLGEVLGGLLRLLR